MNLESVSITRIAPELHIVLCHGFGASKHDLAGLVEWLDPDSRFDWHFPQAPMPLPGFGGWAWFPREAAELLKTMSGEYFSHLESINDPGLDASATEVLALVRSLALPESRLVIGGFSQGSMVALRTVLTGDIHPAGLAILSGSLIDRAGTVRGLSGATPCPVFQSHGRSDQVLAIEGARALRGLLEEATFPLEWCEFAGGHEINEVVVQKFSRFLEERAKA